MATDNFTDDVPTDITADTQSVDVTTKAGNTYVEYASADGIQMAENQLANYNTAQSNDTAAGMQDHININNDNAAITNSENLMASHPTSATAAELKSEEAQLKTDTAALNLDTAKENAAAYDVGQFTSKINTLEGMYSTEQAQQQTAGGSGTQAPVTNPSAPTSGTSSPGVSPILSTTLPIATTSAASTDSQNPSAPTSGTSSPEVSPVLATPSSSSSGSVASPASAYHQPEVGHENLSAGSGNSEGGVGHQNLGDNPTSPYIVKSGDNLSTIAEKYGVSLSDLENSNKNITDPNVIFPGNSINIPTDAKYPAGNGLETTGGSGGDGTSITTSPGLTTATPPKDKTQSQGGNAAAPPAKDPTSGDLLTGSAIVAGPGALSWSKSLFGKK